MNNNPAKYLDRILKVLAKQFGTALSIQEIQNELTPIKIFGKKGKVTFSLDLLLDSQHAIDYLVKQNLVVINLGNGKVFITYEGYMKVKTNGFSKEINEKLINLWLQRMAWLIPLIISSLALWISLSKSTHPISSSGAELNCSKIDQACP